VQTQRSNPDRLVVWESFDNSCFDFSQRWELENHQSLDKSHDVDELDLANTAVPGIMQYV
jgi:hypothetical protein